MFFESSHSKNSLRLFVERSYLCVIDAPYTLQRHIEAPALVLPLRFVSPPYAGHNVFFILRLKHVNLTHRFMESNLRCQVRIGHTFLPITRSCVHRHPGMPDGASVCCGPWQRIPTLSGPLRVNLLNPKLYLIGMSKKPMPSEHAKVSASPTRQKDS